jgi:hypothetical protein
MRGSRGLCGSGVSGLAVGVVTASVLVLGLAVRAAPSNLAPQTSDLGAASAQPQEPILEAPTLLCLGIRWPVQGDSNGNARVELAYRRVGDKTWRPALPPIRVRGESRRERFIVPEALFAGSVFDLRPDTAYELRLRLRDPDGGGTERILKARTRREPEWAATGQRREFHVVPGDGGGDGSKAQPFRGLAAAQAVARPGDVFTLAPGRYTGTFEVTKSGEPGRPIVWRANVPTPNIQQSRAPDRAELDGAGAERAITAVGLHDVHFENLLIRNANWGIVAHESSRITVRRCRFTDLQSGFTATRNESGMRDFYIADNEFIGPSTWPRTQGIEDTEAVQVAGEGHVVCYNRIRGYADAVSLFQGYPNRACDFYNNEISECTDDGIELDYGETNVRAFRNRLTNCFQGISVQPIHGGPAYILRNAMYNVELETFKLHNEPAGVLMLHNTSVKAGMPLVLYTSVPVYNSLSRNNLYLGTAASWAYENTAPMVECDFDYDGFGGGPFRDGLVKWNGVRYRTLAELHASGNLYQHVVLVDPTTAFASGIQPPADHKTQFPVTRNDLRLRRGSAAIDAGERLPNVSDSFRGRAPDLGAYELGQPLPHYGPRPASSPPGRP